MEQYYAYFAQGQTIRRGDVRLQHVRDRRERAIRIEIRSMFHRHQLRTQAKVAVMAYYESHRAAKVMGVPTPARISKNGTSKLSIPGLGASFSRTAGDERSQNLAEAIDVYLRSISRTRSIARTPYDAVRATQILDVVVDLQVGAMPFLRVPGSRFSSNTPNEPLAVWASGTHTNAHPLMHTELILVGSPDGLVGADVTAERARTNDFSFPSDPGYLTPALIEVLDLDIERDDYLYEMQWATDPDDGEAARAASEITARASTTDGNRGTWVRQHLPLQRVVATVTDVWASGERHRTVLARPALIQSTI